MKKIAMISIFAIGLLTDCSSNTNTSTTNTSADSTVVVQDTAKVDTATAVVADTTAATK